MVKLDEKDCIILNTLQKNCRITLTDIAKKVKLSIDSVKKRIKKMENIVYYPKIQIRPRSLGFNNIVDVKIKLHNYTEKEILEFIDFLEKDPHVVELMSLSGGWDLTAVIISKDAIHQGRICAAIRNKFNKIIDEWSESLTTYVYKFEDYDLTKLINTDK